VVSDAPSTNQEVIDVEELAYAGFAVDDLERAKEFYRQTLGVFDLAEVGSDLLSLRVANGDRWIWSSIGVSSIPTLFRQPPTQERARFSTGYNRAPPPCVEA